MKKQWLNISNVAKDLVSRMLDVDPEKRITVDEIFQHPWIRVRISNEEKIFTRETIIVLKIINLFHG